jgi:hypothetical protein
MTQGTNDASAIEVTIAADQVNVIRWLMPAKDLMIGTVGGEWRIRGSENEPVTPTNIHISRHTTHGSANTQAVQVGHSTLFLQRAQKKIRELTYNFDVDGYVAPDLSLLAEHLAEEGIDYIAYQKEPYSILWCVKKDGELLGMTYLREQDVVGWHKHVTAGSVESIAIIPNSDDTSYDLWLAVKRTIAGEASPTQRFVEYMDFTEYNNLEDGYFVDAGLSLDSDGAVNALSGLDHLASEEVAVLGDGIPQATQTVAASSGRITLESGASVVHAGLSYTSTLETMRIEGAVAGTAQGIIKRIWKTIIRVYESTTLEMGPDSDNLEEIGEATPALTGDIAMEFPSGYEREGRIYVRQADPLPLNVLSITAKVEVSEGG